MDPHPKPASSSRTSLVFGRRVDKIHPRVQACGCVDELNSALGLCRAHASSPREKELILARQQELILLMGELAAADEDQERFLADSQNVLEPIHLEALSRETEDLKKSLDEQVGWILPGDSPLQAFYDLARTTCRRAERHILLFQESGVRIRPVLGDYLNRLSTFIWMLERRQQDDASSGECH